MATPHRIPALAVTALLAGGLTLVSLPSTAAAGTSDAARAPMCQGKKATKVGRLGKNIRGTQGADVIVTNGSGIIDSLDGDDLVCVTGPRSEKIAILNVGDGDDSVVIKENRPVYTRLGPGKDHFRGGPNGDSITDFADDGERDVILTYRGDDFVSEVYPGDLVHLGKGDDQASYPEVVPADYQARVNGGPGRDYLSFRNYFSQDPTSLSVDNSDTSAGHAEMDGQPHGAWKNMENFSVLLPQAGSADFVGSDADETFSVGDAEAGPGTPGGLDGTVTADLGGGDDEAVTSVHGATVDFDGGPGRDLLQGDTTGPTDVDLTAHTLTATGQTSPTGTSVAWTGMEKYRFIGSFYTHDLLTVRGTSGPDIIRVAACRASVFGYGGDDTIKTFALFDEDGQFLCRINDPVISKIRAGGGRDTIVGGTGPDVLIGGSGRDFADGGKGRDQCVAEKTKRCES